MTGMALVNTVGGSPGGWTGRSEKNTKTPDGFRPVFCDVWKKAFFLLKTAIPGSGFTAKMGLKGMKEGNVELYFFKKRD